jgi:hypothetical protein
MCANPAARLDVDIDGSQLFTQGARSAAQKN